MRLALRSTCFLAVVLCNVDFSFETEDSLSPKKSVISRRAIDGTRGRKYYDPIEDGFFDDYSFDGGQYDANQDRLDLEDIRRNVPGEPGVDYPAHQRLPQTSFSCEGRPRGYYADEEAGCQLFHVCDDILVSSFLCPVGSIFSQKLLTCDWWNKVDCSLTRKFYEANRHIYDQDDDEMLRKAYAMTGLRVNYEKERAQSGNLVTYVALDRHENDLPNGYDDVLVDPDYRSYASNDDYRNEPAEPYHGHVLYSQDYRTKAPKIYQESPIVRIHKITNDHRAAYEHQSQVRGRNRNNYHRGVNEFENEFQPSYAPTVPTVTTTTRRYYSPTVPTMFRSTTPSYSKRDHTNHHYTHHDESQILPTTPTVFYRDNIFFSTPNPIGQVRNVDVTNYSQKREDRNEDYGQEFGEDMEVRESIGLAQSKDERTKDTVEKTQDVKINSKKDNDTEILVESSVNATADEAKPEKDNRSIIVENTRFSSQNEKQNHQQSSVDRPSSSKPVNASHSDVEVQYHGTRGVQFLTNNSATFTNGSRLTTTERYSNEGTSKFADQDASHASSTSKTTYSFEPIVETVSKPAIILEPPETDLGFRIKVPQEIFTEDNSAPRKPSTVSKFSTIEYSPNTSPSRTAPGIFDVLSTVNLSEPFITYYDKFTTPAPLPVSHLPSINIPPTEIVPPFAHLFAGGVYGTYPTTDSSEVGAAINENHYYYDTVSNSSNVANDTSSRLTGQSSSTKVAVPLTELQPPIYNHKDDVACCDEDDSTRKSTTLSSTQSSVAINESTISSASDKAEVVFEDISDYTNEQLKSIEKIADDDKSADDYEEYKSIEYPQEDEENEKTEPVDFDLSRRVLNLFQIMAELAKTNRFPRPFTRNEPLTINVMSTTPTPEDNSHIAHFTRNSSAQFSAETTSKQAIRRHDLEYDYPVYRGEDVQKTTTAEFAETTTVSQDQIKLGSEVTTLKSDFSHDDEVVETELVPSLGFALSTEEGRDEFAEAVRRGLVSDNDDVHRELSSTENSATEEKDKASEKNE